MSKRGVTESVVEEAALDRLRSLVYEVKHGLKLGPDEPDAERQDYGQVMLAERTAR